MATAASVPMSSHGSSAAVTNTHRSARTAFDAFREHHAVHAALAPAAFDSMTAAQLTNRELWERLATYLIDDHDNKRSHGGNLAAGTVVDYLGALLNIAHRRLKSDASVAAFFSCLAPEARTDEWKWYKGIKDNIWRRMMSRRIAGVGCVLVSV